MLNDRPHLNVYETYLLNKYLGNTIAEFNRRSWNGKVLIKWLDEYLSTYVHLNRNGTPNEALEESVFSLRPLLVEILNIDNPEIVLDQSVIPLCTLLEKVQHLKPWIGTAHLLEQQTYKVLQQISELQQVELARPPRPDLLRIRLLRLARATGLEALDIDILELLIRYDTQVVFDWFFDDIFENEKKRYLRLGKDKFAVSSHVIPVCLGCTFHQFRSRLRRDSPLARKGFLLIDNDGELSITGLLTRFVHEPRKTGEDVVTLLLDKPSASELEWSDFNHVAAQRDHIAKLLQGALQNRAKGVNILLYGPPGTGKTEFCKALAEQLKVSMYAIAETDDENGRHRKSRTSIRQQELIFAQHLLANQSNSLLLFDEMIDLLDDTSGFTSFSPRMGMTPQYGPAGSQVLLHRVLEETPVPVLWTMNDARTVHPAILRRMTFALELREPDINVRKRVWTRQLAKNDIAASADEVQELAREFNAVPAIAAGATRAAGLIDGKLDTVRMGVRGLSRLLNRDQPPQRAPAGFDLGLIAADTDPELLADRIMTTARRDFSLCLQGPPGTGKSAFARYLAERLGLEIMHKRASDLLSKWVGESEQQITAAFAEARDTQAMLVFDEADSLLADRRLARQNWEVSQTNEMLTWMESHPLPFACTTNFADRLDQATLRRFTFKIALDYLTPQQARLAFARFFSLDAPPELALLTALTPGDFAVVRKQAGILGCLQEPDVLLDMLRDECAAKPGVVRTIGFLA